jgi:hypothetical protein
MNVNFEYTTFLSGFRIIDELNTFLQAVFVILENWVFVLLHPSQAFAEMEVKYLGYFGR